MDITCPQCKTEYEFDDGNVTEAGITVKCTNCSYTFRIRRKAIIETEPVSMAVEPSPRPVGDKPKTWMIRSVSGKVLTFQELTTLQQWIVERKVSRDDQISRSGETWKRLGDIAELASFFQVVDAALAAAQPPAPAPSRVTPPPSEPVPAPRKVPSHAEPAFSADASQLKAIGPSAAWETASSPSIPGARLTGELYDEIPRRATGKLLGAAIAGLLVVGLLAAGISQRDTIMGLFSRSSSNPPADRVEQAGRQLFLLDDEESLAQAEQQFARAPRESALSQAARAEVFTTWAQHLRDEATLLERKARRLEGATPATPAAQDPRLLHLEASKLRDEATKKVAQAEASALIALRLAPNRAEVQRAMADALRLLGRDQAAVEQYLAPARKLLRDDAELLYVEAAVELGLGHAAQAEQLLKQALARSKAHSGRTLLRAAFALGMLELEQDRVLEARAQAQAVLDANAKHRWAGLLLAECEAQAAVAKGQPASAPPPAPAPAPTPAPAPAAETPPPVVIIPPPKGANIPTAPPAAGGNYESLIQQGSSLSERGRTAQAFKLFERALQLRPGGVEALTGIGYCHLDQLRYAAAIGAFTQALGVSSGYGDALIGLAEAYKAQGNETKALEHYRAYLQTHPHGPKAVMARRNVTELERRVQPAPQPSAPETPVAPTPAPVPAPVPESTPAPPSEPTPAPVPESTPAPEPTPAPVPEPTPAPPSALESTPAPPSEPTPAPVPESTPAPPSALESTPAPAPVCGSLEMPGQSARG